MEFRCESREMRSLLGVSGPRCSTGVPRLTTLHGVPRVLGGLSWNTRGTLVEHSWNTSDPWGLYSSVGSAHKHSWNTRGTRLGRPRYGKPGARLAILRLVTSSNPDRTWFCIFPSRSQVRVRVVQKNFPSGHGFESRSGHTFEHFCSGHRFESRSCKTLEFL